MEPAQVDKNSTNCLTGKVAVVSGASRGIGREIAVTLAGAGAKLAICARSEKDLDNLKEQLLGRKQDCLAVVCDVSKPEQVEAFCAQVLSHWGQVDVLVNNAGMYETEPVLGHSLELWQTVLETNLTSAFWFSRLLLDSMVSRKWGRIVNISSVSGRHGHAFASAYSASKFGMIGLTQSLAQEVAKYGVTVNAVCPGWVNTKMAYEQFDDEKWCQLNELPKERAVELSLAAVAQERFVEPKEVAELVLFLASNKASAINGQSINICGGLYCD